MGLYDCLVCGPVASASAFDEEWPITCGFINGSQHGDKHWSWELTICEVRAETGDARSALSGAQRIEGSCRRSPARIIVEGGALE